jgi:hypothetical protein
MVYRIVALWLTFSTLAVAGIGLKALPLYQSSNSSEFSDPFNTIEAKLDNSNFSLYKIRKPTTDKNFTVRIYKKLGCDGYLFLMPLERNSEGAPLLKASFPTLLNEIYYVFRGERFASFPTVYLWWSQFVTAMWTWHGNHDSQVVWAVAETSSCVNAVSLQEIM